jgi:hypothetical protein
LPPGLHDQPERELQRRRVKELGRNQIIA